MANKEDSTSVLFKHFWWTVEQTPKAQFEIEFWDLFSAPSSLKNH